MTRHNVPLGRIIGIPIGLDYSWFLVFGLLTWSLAASYYPAEFHGWAPALYWVTGAATAILLFASVLLHELGHSVVALRYKIPVRSINLYIFGGVAEIGSEPPSAIGRAGHRDRRTDREPGPRGVLLAGEAVRGRQRAPVWHSQVPCLHEHGSVRVQPHPGLPARRRARLPRRRVGVHAQPPPRHVDRRQRRPLLRVRLHLRRRLAGVHRQPRRPLDGVHRLVPRQRGVGPGPPAGVPGRPGRPHRGASDGRALHRRARGHDAAAAGGRAHPGRRPALLPRHTAARTSSAS